MCFSCFLCVRVYVLLMFSVCTCICASYICFVFFFFSDCLTCSGLFACLLSKEKEKQGRVVGEDVRGDEGEEKLLTEYILHEKKILFSMKKKIRGSRSF